jgi:histidine phosphotransferase ChpT
MNDGEAMCATMVETRMPNALALAQAVCTRLCHDLGGPTGALGGALELLEDGGDEAADVARDASRIIDRRLRFWRAAVGGTGAELDAGALAQLAEGLTLGRKAAVDLEGLTPGMLVPSELIQPLLLAMLVGVEAMPRGGTLRVAGGVEEGVGVWPDGPGAAWPPGLPALLAGEEPTLTPRSIALPLLAATAAAGRVRLELLMPGGGPNPGVLLLAPRAGH